tara:strand:- start:287 stop:745 length:459 start_codon:yes stop_codon:yes gene_type:complete
MKSQKALDMVNTMIGLLIQKIKNYQDGYYVDAFHYDQCMINESLIIIVGNGKIIVHENFFREGVSSNGVGEIYKNSNGTDYGWMLQINDTYAFVDCDRDVHIWERKTNSEQGPLYFVEHKLLDEESKIFLEDLKGGDENVRQGKVVITFAND